MIGYELNGRQLVETGRWELLKATFFAPAVSVRSVNQVIPGVDGVLLSADEPTDAPVMGFSHRVRGGSDGTLEVNRGELMRILAGPPGGESELVRIIDGAATTARAKLVSTTKPEYSPFRKMIAFDSVFTLPGVWWRSPQLIDWASGVLTSGQPVLVPGLAGCTGPVDDALLLLTGPFTAFTVVDQLSGGWLRVTHTVPAGQAALVDCAQATVRVGADVTFTGGGIDVSSDLQWGGGPLTQVLRINPDMTGNVYLRPEMVGSGAATRLAVRARKSMR